MYWAHTLSYSIWLTWCNSLVSTLSSVNLRTNATIDLFGLFA